MTPCAATGVWIDARSALVMQWSGQSAGRTIIVSTVPPHRRSCGRAAERGLLHHGAGGPRSAGETHRLEHLRTYIDEVRTALPDDDLLLIGDGAVVDRLAREIGSDDARRRLVRRVVVTHSNPLSEPQLLARLRLFAGSPPRRRMPRPVPRLLRRFGNSA